MNPENSLCKSPYNKPQSSSISSGNWGRSANYYAFGVLREARSIIRVRSLLSRRSHPFEDASKPKVLIPIRRADSGETVQLEVGLRGALPGTALFPRSACL